MTQKPLIEVQVCAREGVTYLRVSGELDISTGHHLREHLVDLIQERPNRVVTVNLAGVTFIDSSGLSVLVTAHKRLEGAGGKLIIEDPQPRIMHVLELSGLRSILAISSSGGRQVVDREERLSTTL